MGEEEEEEAQEEEGEEGPLRGRQAPQGPAQEQGVDRGGQAECRQAEEVRQGHLQAGDALRRPVEGHRHQRQDHPRPGVQALWAYIKKKGINKGRTVGKIDGLWNGGSMFQMTAAVSKHIK